MDLQRIAIKERLPKADLAQDLSIPLGPVQAQSLLKDVLYRNELIVARKERLAKKTMAVELKVDVLLDEIERIKKDDQAT